MTDIFTINSLPGRYISHEGRNYLFFSGTAYLGISQNPGFQQLLVESIGRYGTVFGSSRNGNLRIGVYEEAEAKLATWVGAESALTVSSGMMAGQLVVNWLQAQGIVCLHGPGAHPAIWTSPNMTTPSTGFADWAAQLPEQLKTVPAGPIAILVNSIEAVRSEYYAFDWVDNLPDDRPITLVVDDSHGLGVLNKGCGIWPQLPKKQNVTLLVAASLAKAMGLPGGVVLGDVASIQAIRSTAFFGACSPIPPAYLDAYLRADAYYTEGRERLTQNLILAEKLLSTTGLFSQAKGYPVFFTKQDDLYPYLLEKGIFIYSFAYPTASDRANSRIVISAFHEFADIQKLAEAIYTYCF